MELANRWILGKARGKSHGKARGKSLGKCRFRLTFRHITGRMRRSSVKFVPIKQPSVDWGLSPKAFRSLSELHRTEGMVPTTGLEPVRCYSLEPESSASANSATWATPVTKRVGAQKTPSFRRFSSTTVSSQCSPTLHLKPPGQRPHSAKNRQILEQPQVGHLSPSTPLVSLVFRLGKRRQESRT